MAGVWLWSEGHSGFPWMQSPQLRNLGATTCSHRHTHTHTQTPQRSSQGLLLWEGEILVRMWEPEHLLLGRLQLLASDSSQEESAWGERGWGKSIAGVVLLIPKGPSPLATPSRSCSLLVSRSSPNTLPPAPPLLLPHAKTCSRPVTAYVHLGPRPGGRVCRIQASPPKGHSACSLDHKVVPGKLTCEPLRLALPPPPDAPTYPLSMAFGSRWWGPSQQWCPANPGQRPHRIARFPGDQRAVSSGALEKTGSWSAPRSGWGWRGCLRQGRPRSWEDWGRCRAGMAWTRARWRKKPSHGSAPLLPHKGTRLPGIRVSPQNPIAVKPSISWVTMQEKRSEGAGVKFK